MPEKWVPMKDAAKELDISPSRVSRLAAIGVIEVRESRINRRIKLVNVEQIKKLLETQGMESDR